MFTDLCKCADKYDDTPGWLSGFTISVRYTHTALNLAVQNKSMCISYADCKCKM